MSHTLLDGVNELLKRVGVIDTANVGLLTSLTYSAQQSAVDVAVQVINEGIDELFTASHKSLPKQSQESTIVLVIGQREYSLATDLVTLKWPMIDRVNTQYLFEWNASYEEFLFLDPQQQYTGLPIWGMISPITSKVRLDRAPDSTVVGHTYYYEYERDTVLIAATDVMPFIDITFRAMVPAWVQLWKREKRNEFDQSLFQQAIGRASRTVTEDKARTSYSPRD